MKAWGNGLSTDPLLKSHKAFLSMLLEQGSDIYVFLESLQSGGALSNFQ